MALSPRTTAAMMEPRTADMDNAHYLYPSIMGSGLQLLHGPGGMAAQ